MRLDAPSQVKPQAVLPASTVIVVPVIMSPPLPSKNETEAATAPTEASLPDGLRRLMDKSLSPAKPFVMSVSMYPGATQLTVMPAFPSSRDSDLVKPIKPALVAAYTDNPLKPVDAVMDDILIIRPQPASSMERETHLVRTMGD